MLTENATAAVAKMARNEWDFLDDLGTICSPSIMKRESVSSRFRPAAMQVRET